MNCNQLEIKTVGIFSAEPRPEMIDFLVKWFEPHGIGVVPLDNQSPKQAGLDLIMTIGGDGTVLRALSHFPDCPVLAVNYGNVGFLTAGNREELTDMLEQTLAGKYIVSERSVLECIHPYGTDYAVNEVVVRGATRLIAVELSIDDLKIRCVRGDGIIVGTATGSTAYLLAAGSPIVMPELRCMIITGLNEYDFRARHLVITNDSQVKLKVAPNTHEKEVYLSADGKEKVPLQIGDEIMIRESNNRARLIFMEKNYFFHNLSSRLSWFRGGE